MPWEFRHTHSCNTVVRVDAVDDSCKHANDGNCDEYTGVCAKGTDCGDCGYCGPFKHQGQPCAESCCWNGPPPRTACAASRAASHAGDGCEQPRPRTARQRRSRCIKATRKGCPAGRASDRAAVVLARRPASWRAAPPLSLSRCAARAFGLSGQDVVLIKRGCGKCKAGMQMVRNARHAALLSYLFGERLLHGDDAQWCGRARVCARPCARPCVHSRSHPAQLPRVVRCGGGAPGSCHHPAVRSPPA